MATNPIHYSDLVSPDGSIKDLIEQLKELKGTYAELMKLVKENATSIDNNLKKTGSSTEESRKSIDEAAVAASRLERAQKELAFALSETGKQVAWLKAQTTSANKATVEQQRYLQQAVSSYDRLKSDLKEAVGLYKSLTEAERNDSQMGQQLLAQILQYKKQLSELDKQLKLQVQSISALEKAKQKLAYLQSEEGKQLLDIQNKIRAEVAARREQKAQVSDLERAKRKLAAAQSAENEQIKLYNLQAHEANEVARLNAIVASNAEGSYNRLSAQYALNKIQLNKLSAEERSATQAGQELEKQTYEIYQQMIKLQEATGNHKLSVGNYKKAWDGLGMSVNQIVREIPSAAISINTFFLAISNNIPILIDEMDKLRRVNAKLIAQGDPAISVTKRVVKALINWRTGVVLALAALAMFGDEIIDWVGSLFKANKTLMTTAEMIDEISKKLSQGDSFGDAYVSLKKLSDEYSKLTSQKDKLKFIKDNQRAFEDLGIAINNTNEADAALVNYTPKVLEALKARAKAAAAESLAKEAYQKALSKEIEYLKAQKGGPKTSFGTFIRQGIVSEADPNAAERLPEEVYKERLKLIREEKEALYDLGDSYYDMSAGFAETQKEILSGIGLKLFEGGDKKKDRKPALRDTEDTLESLSLAATKAYQESITELEKEEIAKRRKQTLEAYNVEVADLNKKYNKIQRILDGQDERYKKLTDEQKEQALKAQDDILKALENIQSKSKVDLSNLTYAEQEHALSNLLATTELQAQAAKQGSEDEIRLRLRLLEIERQIAIARNKQLPPSEQQSESDINAGFNKQRTGIVTDYNMSTFDQQQALDEAEFNAVKRTEDEITKFKLQQERDRWVQQIALAKAGALDWSDAQIKAAEATVTGIDRKLAELDDFIAKVGDRGVSGAILSNLGFDNKAISAFDSAVDTVISNLQEIAQAEVDLAQAAVDAAEERVDAAQSAYEAELEARNNGYANSVASARRELQQEKKRQQEKQKLLEEAQRRQEAINTVVQSSSLITASAQIWSSMSGVPIIGPALAIAAIAAMWTSFAAAKIKARQVTASSEEYGEGGLEVLEGGSHASGHDIDLGVKNRRKKRMKAEGGEALAIINKRSTAKYKKVLPDVIESLNKGIFEEKYVKAFSQADNMSLSVYNDAPDLSKLESGVSEIVKQNRKKYVVRPDGSLIEIDGSTVRVIKK